MLAWGGQGIVAWGRLRMVAWDGRGVAAWVQRGVGAWGGGGGNARKGNWDAFRGIYKFFVLRHHHFSSRFKCHALSHTRQHGIAKNSDARIISMAT